MKHNVLLIIGFLSLLLCSACSSSGDSLEKSLIGTWYDRHSAVAPQEGMIINADHTGCTFYKDLNRDFRWKLDGDILSIVHNDPANSKYDRSGHAVISDDNGYLGWDYSSFTLNPDECLDINGGGSGSGGGGSSTGKAPSSLSTKLLSLYKTDKSYWMGIYHVDGKCAVDLYNGAMLAEAYPPKFTYTAKGSQADYSLTFVTQTYVPFYGSYTYAQFQVDITLQFKTSVSGTYSGTQTNMNGDAKKISGIFDIE